MAEYSPQMIAAVKAMSIDDLVTKASLSERHFLDPNEFFLMNLRVTTLQGKIAQQQIPAAYAQVEKNTIVYAFIDAMRLLPVPINFLDLVSNS